MKHELLKAVEECSEVIHAICKTERFGLFNYHPERPQSSNLKELETEIDQTIVALLNLQDVLRSKREEKEREP